MNTFRKSFLALATLSTMAFAAAAPAQAGNNWQKPFVKGLGLGVGMGVVGAILQPRQPQTIVVAQPAYQPTCYLQNQQFQDAYGVLHVHQVQVCQ